MWGQADRVEVRFRSSKGDQLRDGTVMTRACADPPLPLRDGGGAVELMIKLLSSGMFLPSHAPLAASGTARDNWSVWTQARATGALRREVALAGFAADEYALHSLRIGGATFQSPGGASVDVVQREGRRMSDTYKGYVRSRAVDAKAVSDMLADADSQPVLQLGQRTVWDING